MDSGKILIDEKDVTKLPEYKRAKFLGRVFQDPMNGTAGTMENRGKSCAGASQRWKTDSLKPGITEQREKALSGAFSSAWDSDLRIA